ncbi:MAG: hypothetical protein HKN74_01725 [Acidimicrobiia bacterium]|nr:hypothetical protein [Acidimicrobiia bacterium]
MSYEDRVLALFGDANPVPGDADVTELSRPTLQLIEQREDAMSDTKVRTIDTDRPIVKQERGRRVLYGAAAALVALIVGTISWIAWTAVDEPSPDSATGFEEGVEVIETFFQRWTDGDASGAMSLVGDQDFVAGNVFLGPEIEYVIALEPDGWFWSVTDCAEQVPGTFNCSVRLVGDPLFDALGVAAARAQFTVEDGKLGNMPRILGIDAAQADQRLATYAEQDNPIGYEANCVGANGRAWEGSGVVYNRACGAFLSQYLAPLAAELTAP